MALVGLAASDGSAGADRPRGTSDRKAEAKARELYRQGLAHYNLAEFDAAIVKFKAAYTLSPEPELLFNLGQAYRFRHPTECTQALWHFRAYVRAKPESPQRAAVERLVEETERCAAEEKRAAGAAPDQANRSADDAHAGARTADPTSIPSPAPDPAGEPRPVAARVANRRSSSAPLWAMGASVLVAGTGTGLLVWSDAEYDALVSRCAPACTRDDVSGGVLAQRLGIGFAAFGAVALAGSFAWWLGGRDEDAGGVSLVVTSAGIGASGAF